MLVIGREAIFFAPVAVVHLSDRVSTAMDVEIMNLEVLEIRHHRYKISATAKRTPARRPNAGNETAAAPVEALEEANDEAEEEAND